MLVKLSLLYDVLDLQPSRILPDFGQVGEKDITPFGPYLLFRLEKSVKDVDSFFFTKLPLPSRHCYQTGVVNTFAANLIAASEQKH